MAATGDFSLDDEFWSGLCSLSHDPSFSFQRNSDDFSAVGPSTGTTGPPLVLFQALTWVLNSPSMAAIRDVSLDDEFRLAPGFPFPDLSFTSLWNSDDFSAAGPSTGTTEPPPVPVEAPIWELNSPSMAATRDVSLDDGFEPPFRFYFSGLEDFKRMMEDIKRVTSLMPVEVERRTLDIERMVMSLDIERMILDFKQMKVVDVEGKIVDIERMPMDIKSMTVDFETMKKAGIYTTVDDKSTMVDVKSMMVDFERMSVYLERRTVDVERMTVDVERTMVDVEGTKVDIERTTMDVERRAVGVERRTMDVERRTMNVERMKVGVERTTVDVEKMTVDVERKKVETSNGRSEVAFGERLQEERSPQGPQAYPNGAHMQIGSSEQQPTVDFDVTCNGGNIVITDQSDIPVTGSEKNNIKMISPLLSLEILPQLYRMKQDDAAKFLGVSRSTFKRECRKQGIPKWPFRKGKKGSNYLPTEGALCQPSLTIGPINRAELRRSYLQLTESIPSAPYCVPNTPVSMHPRISAGQMSTLFAGCSEFLKSLHVPKKAKVVLESTETVPPCSELPPELGASSIAHTMPHVAAMQDMKTFNIKARHRIGIIQFPLYSSSRKVELEENISERLNLNLGNFRISYMDTEGDWILITCDKDLHYCMIVSEQLGHNTIKMLVEDITTM